MKIDLNLLRVLDVLMELRSVSRAADRLGLTQSAISHALGRLREQIGDPLFIRTGGGLRPTQRAQELVPAVRSALAILHKAIAPAAFDPASTTRQFTICASSYFGVTLLPIFVRLARIAAPEARFRIVPGGPDIYADMAEGSVDLALGGFHNPPTDLRTMVLHHERLVWAGRAGTDLGDLTCRPRLAFTRARPFTGTETQANRPSLSERMEIVTAGMSADAPTPLTIHDPLTAIAFIRTSDLVTLIPRQLALRLTDRQGVAFRDAEEQPPIAIGMLWHGRTEDDPAHRWLRRLMVEAAAELA